MKLKCLQSLPQKHSTLLLRTYVKLTCPSEEKLLFSGDRRQVAPVLPFGTESEIVEYAFFLSSGLWSHAHHFRLTKCMREKNDIPYATTVLAVGEGKIESVLWPMASPLFHRNTQSKTTMARKLHLTTTPTTTAGGILAPTTDNIDQINDFILRKMPGNVHERLRSEKKCLNSMNVPGTPTHKLNLKIGAQIFFIRNINVVCGLLNGERGVFRGIS
ncbi:unnamed protein product [Ectocarpus sp. 13 AM-2016]